MVQHLNGYACYNPADAALAKRGIAPAAPRQAAGTQLQTITPPAPGSPSTGQLSAARLEPAQLSAPTVGRGQLVNLVA